MGKLGLFSNSDLKDYSFDPNPSLQYQNAHGYIIQVHYSGPIPIDYFVEYEKKDQRSVMPVARLFRHFQQILSFNGYGISCKTFFVNIGISCHDNFLAFLSRLLSYGIEISFSSFLGSLDKRYS